jgi:N-acylneuraminate cytidylyltransferase
VEQYEERNPGLRVDIIVLLYPTAPLRDVESIDKAVAMVKSGDFDSAISVYHDTRYLWKIEEDGETITPTNYDPNNRMPRQKEVWNQWAENKAIYVMRREVLFAGGRIGKRCGYVEMEKWRSVDIDEEADLIMARALINSAS